MHKTKNFITPKALWYFLSKILTIYPISFISILLMSSPIFAQDILIKVENAKYFDKNHNLFSGTYVEYYENGVKKLEMNIKNGELDSTTTLYYLNGQVMEIRSYRKGLMDGKWVKYNANGKILSIAEYKNDKKHGTWLIYDEEGNLRYEMHYLEGVKCGTWKNFNKEGKVVESRNFDINCN